MKTLVITRHAKSSWNSDAIDDFSRPLNKRGLRDAPVMAQRLQQRGPIPQLVVSSTAARALATTKLMLPAFEISEDQLVTTDEIYEAPVSALAQTIKAQPDTFEIIMLVGHNPGVSGFAEFLSVGAHLQMPTCAMACLQLDIDSWKDLYRDCANLLWYDYPKNSDS